MSKLFIYILLTLFLYKADAQTIKIGNLYKGQGEQGALNSIIDKTGARYSLVIYDTDFVVDSAGTPVTIHNTYNNNTGLNYNAIVIIKYDSSGKYLFHFGINTPSTAYNSEILTDIDENNNLIIAYTFYGLKYPSQVFDSLDLIDSKRILYKRIYTPVSYDRTNIIICKIDANGQFQWANTITRWKISPSDSLSNFIFNGSLNPVTRRCNSIMHNNINEIFINLDLYELQHPYYDTLTLTLNSGINIPIYISQKDLLIRFSTSGSLMYYIAPYQLKVNSTADYTYTLRSVCDGINKYTLLRITTPSPDTLLAPTLLPLDTGFNIVLIKTDNNDSIVWAKLIGCDTGYYARSAFASTFVLCLNRNTMELALGLKFWPYSFTFSQPLNETGLSATNPTLLIARLTTSGNFIHYAAYGSVTFLNSLSYHPLTNDLIVIGENAMSNLSIGNYNLQNLTFDYRYFVAFFDAVDTCVGAKLIDATGIGYGGGTSYNGFQDLGNQITDKKGRTYLSGFFTNVINLPCQTDAVTQYNDGFVFIIEPPAKLIDTSVCYSMLSPSGKYLWDSSAKYCDTIANSLGCDSILAFRLKILSSKSEQDSTVCGGMRSYSDKYYWQNSGIYKDTIPNVNKCDSVITLNLTVLNSKKDSIKIVSCKNYISPSAKYTYYQTGNYYDTIPTIIGCDSIIFIDYTKTLDSSSIRISSCKNYISPSAKYAYSQTGNYIDTILTVQSCDSIIFISYIKTVDSSHLSISSCKEYISPSAKYSYSTTGNYIDTISNTLGCDSIIFINFTISKIKLSVSKSNDISCDTPFTQLLATGARDYIWDPDQNLSNHLISNPISTAKSSIFYKVTGTDSAGCSESDSIMVNVVFSSKEFLIPNVFTPNGDGINDCFFKPSDYNIKKVQLSIFNRWGNEVFNSFNVYDCWNGKTETLNDVAGGTYFFIMSGYNNCDLPFQYYGTIEVLR